MIKRDLYYERIHTKSQRDDVRYLGETLGKVIKKQDCYLKQIHQIKILKNRLKLF